MCRTVMSPLPPKKMSSLFFIHLLTSVHLLTVSVTVAGVGVHTDQGTAGVGLITCRNCQGWESWGGEQIIKVTDLTETTPLLRSTTHTATCDGVENFFGKGGIYGVSVACDSHSSSHAEVISGSLTKVQAEQRGDFRRRNPGKDLTFDNMLTSCEDHKDFSHNFPTASRRASESCYDQQYFRIITCVTAGCWQVRIMDSFVLQRICSKSGNRRKTDWRWMSSTAGLTGNWETLFCCQSNS